MGGGDAQSYYSTLFPPIHTKYTAQGDFGMSRGDFVFASCT
jgi:hypothetical protein